MIGYIYINEQNNVTFKFNTTQIDILGSKELKKIYSVKEYDKTDGYIVLDTNYGEEFYCLSETIFQMDLADIINIPKELSAIEKFIILSKK